jgi:hypothetical protein
VLALQWTRIDTSVTAVLIEDFIVVDSFHLMLQLSPYSDALNAMRATPSD